MAVYSKYARGIGSLAIVWWIAGLLTSCERRPLEEDYADYVPVTVKIDWSGVANKPTMMKVCFYPVSRGRKTEIPIEPDGGVVQVPIGTYRVIVYNWDTRTILFRGESYEEFEAYTGESSKGSVFSKLPGDKVLMQPDHLYVWSTGNELFEVRRLQSNGKPGGRTGIEPNTIYAKPFSLVKHYTFDIDVVGLQYVSSCDVAVDGVVGSVWMCSGKPIEKRYSVLADLGKTASGFRCSFSTFGFKPGEVHKVLFRVYLPDGSCQDEVRDVTELTKESEFFIPEPIIIDFKPGEGGFVDPTIGEWEKEDGDIIL